MTSTISKDEHETLDAYDQGRIDTNEMFVEILKRGIQETSTREELINFIVRELNSMGNETKEDCNCD